MTFGDVWPMVSGLASLAAVVLSLYTLITARNRQDVDALLASSSDQAGRLTKLESDVRHLPDAATVHELRVAIVEMKGQLSVIVERVGPIKAIAERLQESMLEHGK